MKINTWRLFGVIGLVFMFITIVTFAAGAARGLEPQEEPTIEEPAPTTTVDPSPEPTPAPTLAPEDDPFLFLEVELYFARMSSEQLAEWAATQEASDRAWLAQETASFGAGPSETTWLWHPCWPPEAMPWYPPDFPPPEQWQSVAIGCRR